MRSNNKGNLYNTAMAAAKVNCTQSYIRQLIAKGKIKAVKFGHDWIMTARALSRIKRQRKPKNS